MTEPSAPLWPATKVGVALAGGAVGAAGLVAGWYGSGGEAELVDQLGWINFAVAATFLALGAQVLLLSTARRALRGRQTAALRSLAHFTGALTAVDAITHQERAVVAGTARYHHPGCVLISTRPATEVQVVALHEARSSRRRACEVCGA